MEPEEFGEDDRRAACHAASRIVQEVWEADDKGAATVFATTAAEIATWRTGSPAAPVTDEQLLRISYVLGIHAALSTLVPDQSQHARFTHQGTPGLDGATPIAVMSQGLDGLRRVRRWLDGECQW